MPEHTFSGERGFGLAEVLIASGLLIVVAAGVSQLTAMAVRAGHAASTRTTATLAAVSRMEALRADPALQPSPPGTLAANVPLFVEHLDREGIGVGNGATPPAEATFTCRWAVTPLVSDPAHTLVLQVLVTRARPVNPGQRAHDDVELLSVRTRVQGR